MSTTLRDYQIDIVQRARTSMQRGIKSLLLVAPTGSGKTLLTAHMLGSASEKKMDSWFIVHRRELIKQSVRTFHKVGIPHGVVAAGFMEDRRHRIQIASIQTISRRLNRLRPPKLIVWDECHHMAATSWAKVYAAFPNAFHVGLTATPERLDGKGLGGFFKEMLAGPSVATLIEQGFLSRYKIFAPSNVNLAGVHTQMGDFNKSELAARVDKPSIVGQAIDHYIKYASGKRALVRGVSVEHSKHIANQFKVAGIAACHVDGETPTEERDYAMEMFVEGKILVLCFVDLFSEGVDVPGIEAVIDLRPTQSLTLWLQFCGRALRPAPGKEVAIICDAAGNTLRHGLPDEERVWSLDGITRRKQSEDGSTPSVKICPRCFAAQFAGASACRFCGSAFEIRAREVAQIDGELEEIDKEALRRSRKIEQGRTETIGDLIALGKSRGYRNPFAWARYVFASRQARKLRGAA